MVNLDTHNLILNMKTEMVVEAVITAADQIMILPVEAVEDLPL